MGSQSKGHNGRSHGLDRTGLRGGAFGPPTPAQDYRRLQRLKRLELVKSRRRELAGR